jgi:thioredoxin 1
MHNPIGEPMSAERDEELENLKQRRLAEMSARKQQSGVTKMSHPYLELTDDNFESNLNGAKGLMVVDFWASWCGPCMMMAPVFEQLAVKYKDKALLAKMNVDDNKAVPEKFGVYGIPTFIFFKGGQEVGRAVGAMGQKGLEAEIEKHL